MAHSYWADYLITEVRYDAKRKHIQQVKVRRYNGEEYQQDVTEMREEVVRLLKQKSSVVTAPPNKDKPGYLKKGDTVIYMSNGFIRTDGNSREEDNLGNLPEF